MAVDGGGAWIELRGIASPTHSNTAQPAAALTQRLNEAVFAARARHGDDPLFDDILNEAECLLYLAVPASVPGSPSTADIATLAQLELFAGQLERGLHTLSLQLDQGLARVRVLREQCATVIRKSRASEVAAVPASVRLTPHQVLVLQLATSGRDNAEIATVLGIASETVKTHLRAAFRKLGVHSRAGAVRYLLEHPPNGGFLPP
jgi:DNA-binding CsgD family transcriptional regulator